MWLTRDENVSFCFKTYLKSKDFTHWQTKRNPRGTSSLTRRTFSDQLDTIRAPGLERQRGKIGFWLPASGCVKALPGKAFHRVAPGIVFLFLRSNHEKPFTGRSVGGPSRSKRRPAHSRVKPKMYCRSLLRLAWGRKVLLSSSVFTRFSRRSFRTCGQNSR